jgi:short-subunit dehydrogenase
MTEFSERYGDWAVVAGASEGVGLAFARAMAERGVNVVLISRRGSLLDEAAADIRRQWSVETRTLVVDLADVTGADAVMDATSDVAVGMFVYCAGADPNFVPFLDAPVATAVALVQRNCLVPMQLCHHFAPSMVERRHGGIVLVTSGAALVGARRMVAYGASKAFDLVMGEALWAELHNEGVDVLSLVLGVTDTPALRRLLAERGNLASDDDGTPIPGAATADEVVSEALANLASGPTHFVGETLREGSKVLGGMARSDAARVMLDAGAGVMDQKLS